MNKFYSFLILGFSILFLLSGCKTTSEKNIEFESLLRSRSIMRTTLKESPFQSRVYFENVANIICLTSSQPTTDIEKFTKDIKSIPATSKQEEIVNDLLSVWSNETNSINKQLILRGVCSGMSFALYYPTGSPSK